MAAAHTPELLSRAQAWLSLPLEEKRRKAGLDELAALYAAITGEPTSSCRQCQYSDYAGIVVAYTREATTTLFPETMSDSKYTFANGYENEQFVHEDYATTITKDNLTDEAAEFFIKNGFGHAIIKKPDAVAAEKEAAEKQKAADKAQKEADKAKAEAEKKAAAEKAAADKKAAAEQAAAEKKAAAEQAAKEKAEQEAAEKAAADTAEPQA